MIILKRGDNEEIEMTTSTCTLAMFKNVCEWWDLQVVRRCQYHDTVVFSAYDSKGKWVTDWLGQGHHDSDIGQVSNPELIDLDEYVADLEALASDDG